MKAFASVPLTAAMALLTALVSVGTGQTTVPSALDAVDRELQALFRQSRAQLIRARIPLRVKADHPMRKWQLRGDPRLRLHLERIAEYGEKPTLFIKPIDANPGAGGSSTQPTQPSTDISDASPPLGQWVHFECMGLVLNRRGDVLLPLHLDKVELEHPLRINLPDQRAMMAVLVASDEKIGLSIVRMERPVGTPVRFADRRPAPGALVLMVSSSRPAARLEIWTGAVDDSAILFNRDGEVTGLCREGRALYGTSLEPLVDQLLQTGRIRRAQLGARVREIAPDDPRRLQQPLLASRSAAVVEEVIAGSPGEAAGLEAGDVIVALATEPFQDVQSFAAALGTVRGPTELRILRNGDEVALTVDFQTR